MKKKQFEKLMDFQWLLESCWQKAFIFPSPAQSFLVVFQQKSTKHYSLAAAKY